MTEGTHYGIPDGQYPQENAGGTAEEAPGGVLK